MPDDKHAPHAPSVKSRVDAVLAIASVLIGGMYVSGVLISNVHLIDLGISDFSSLEARNVMVGFQFWLYAAMLLVVLGVLALGLRQCLSLWQHLASQRTLRIGWFWTVRFVLTLLGAAALASAFGTIVGFMYPWGQPWSNIFDFDQWTPGALWAPSVEGWQQFFMAYGHPKVIAWSSAMLFILGFFLWLREMWENLAARGDEEEGEWKAKSWFVTMAAVFMLLSGGLLLSGYANKVYPNLKYNIGGGQPALASLHVKVKDPSLVHLLGVKFWYGGAEQAIVTKPVAIWHQDKEYIYVVPLGKGMPVRKRIAAVSTELVLGIEYVHGYVRVESGGTIADVLFEDPESR